MIWNTLSALSFVLPVAMTVLGLVLWRCPPKGPNWILGFRSRRARASDEVWLFAQSLAGKVWFCLGLVLLLAALLVCGGQRETGLEERITAYLWLIASQVIAVAVVILAVNIVLMCRYDRFGRPRQKKLPHGEDDEPYDAPEEDDYAEPEEVWDEYTGGFEPGEDYDSGEYDEEYPEGEDDVWDDGYDGDDGYTDDEDE